MKLYYHPASTTSRPILQFCADADIRYEPVIVDLMTGEHFSESFTAINPNCMVPVIEDDGFVLTESSAILKYLADKFQSPAYPTELKQRARVNEMMDWFNANLYRELGYHLIYPQIFPHHARQPEIANHAMIEWGRTETDKLLRTLNDHYLAGGDDCLCCDRITIADYFCAALITAGELIGNELHDYANIDNWLQTVKALPSWSDANAAHDGFAAAMKDKAFITLSQEA